MFRGNADALVFKPDASHPVHFLQVYTDAGIRRAVFDRVLKKDEEELPKKGFVAEVRELFFQVALDGDALRTRARGDERAGLFQNFIQVDGFGGQAQLPGIRQGQSEETLHNPAKLLQLAVNHLESLLVVLGHPWTAHTKIPGPDYRALTKN